VEVRGTTLDAVARGENIDFDFLKVDTQGSEFEILRGAHDVLSRSAVGAVVETWTAEVHQGQHLTGEILSLMHELDFELVDMNVAAAWRRRPVDTVLLRGKPQVTGLDLLFFKTPTAPLQSQKRVKLATIAALYGHPDFALDVLGDEELQLRRAIMIDARPQRRPVRGLARLERLLGRQPRIYPSLHS
jgi:hypothetical protein